MSGMFHDGALDQVWPVHAARQPFRATAGRWSWPVSLAVIAGLSVAGWGAIFIGLARLFAA